MATANRDELTDVTRQFFDWLGRDALPLWSSLGVDRNRGGFVEQLTVEGQIVADVRRARLVARQIFSFGSAAELGWGGPARELVDHGLTALHQFHLGKDFSIAPRYRPADAHSEGDFDLYDHAFVIFGLAHAYRSTGDGQLERTATKILQRMQSTRAMPGGGFAEHRPARAPLKANPHMHLLEACLAWSESSSDGLWVELSSALVDLCLTRFIDKHTGALHEYFETDWSIADGPDDVIEPGHQAEWAWLLLRAAQLRPSTRAAEAAARLQSIAEKAGLNPSQDRLMNELNPDLSVRDGRLRLWPQTERIKILVSLHERDGDRSATDRLTAAVRALLGYFDHPISGSWWEHFDERGEPVREPARASSLYHIMGAATELSRLTGMRLD